MCRTYWVLWKTRNARLARKSRAVRSPAAGRRVNPVYSEERNVLLEIRFDQLVAHYRPVVHQSHQ